MNMTSRRRRLKDSEKARRITFYRNGDYFDVGVKVALLKGPRPFPTMPHLLDYLSQKTRMPAKKIFSVSDGKEIKSLNDFKDGASYVVSSDGKFSALAYGSVPRVQTSFIENALPAKARDLQLYRPQEYSSIKKERKSRYRWFGMLDPSTTRREGRMLTVAAKNGGAKAKLLFNDRNPPPFEDLLRDFGRALGLEKVMKMATASGRQVRSISQMKNEFHDVDTFFLEDDSSLIEQNKSHSAYNNKQVENKSAISRKVIKSYKIKHELPLTLDWIHGYDGSKLITLEDGELLYYVGTFVVLFRRSNARQRHYLGHTEDVCSICVHPSGRMVASGQISSGEQLAAIHIWLVESLQTIAIVNRMYGNPVSIDFSAHDFVLLSVEVGPEEDCLSFWDWETDALLAKVQMAGERLAGGCFHPREPDLAITFGEHHMAFWRRRKDGFLSRSDILAPGHSGRTILSWAFIGDSTLAVGDSSGYLTLWSILAGDSFKILKEVRAHQGEVKTLLVMREGTLISGGENQLKAWDTHQKLQYMATTDLETKQVKSICLQGPGDAALFIGTAKSIIEGSMQSSFRVLIQGIEAELVDLDVDAEEKSFVTIDRLRNISRWNARQLLWETKSQMDCCSVGYHPEGQAVTVGGSNGKLLVLHAEGGLVVATIFVADEALKALAYNSDGSILAVGCEDGNIYVCGSKNHGYTYKIHTVLKNNGPIMQMDWSSDGEYLQSSYRKANFFEVSLWKVSETKKISSSQSQTMDWPQHTCTLSYNVLDNINSTIRLVQTFNCTLPTIQNSFKVSFVDLQGIWKRIKGVFYLSCHRKQAKIATGAQDGYLRIFPYPYKENDQSAYDECKQSSQPINVVRFLNSNNVLSCSATHILIWNVKN